MMRKMKIIVLCLVVSGMLNPGTGNAEQQDGEHIMTRAQMEKVRERIETLKMLRMTKALELDERSSALVFPLLNRYDKKRADIERSLWNGLRELRESLKEKREARLRALIEKIESDHKTIERINDEERAELKKVLSVEQQARFILFQREFNRDIKRIITDTRERRLEQAGKERP
ncbi:MAG TPA: hypothetical protein VN260_08195 [Dissulfurispiraceae bacterium]|nr:hypothetical protein [Dissulfurispiraceae bacterium]